MTAAAWDGQHWVTLGSGPNSAAYSIVEHAGSVYFGGYFSTAGGKASFGVARWSGTIATPPARTPWLSEGRPNPFLTTADFSYRLDQPATIRVAVYDVRGREIKVLADGQRTAGLHPVQWDGRDRAGRKMPSGVYFISVQNGNGSVTSTKIVHVQ